MAEERKRLTVPDLKVRKKANEKVVMVSIPDYPSAVWAERAGIDIAAVGDSLGMTNYGHSNTLSRHCGHDDPACAGCASGCPQLHGAGRHALRQLCDRGDRRAQCASYHEGGRRRRC